MHNPQSIHECENEKVRSDIVKTALRSRIDTLMTGIGLVASVSSVPQVLKIWQTKEVAGISLVTYLIAFAAVVAWLLYGVYIKNRPLAITSAVSAAVLGTVIVQIFLYST